MMVLFVAGVLVCWWAEAAGNPIHHAARRRRRRRQHGRQGSPLRHLQLRALRHHHHRRLLRRGQLDARLLHAARRAGAAVQHADSAKSIFGGVGAGLYGMLVFVVLAVFIAGLMVGRTPEYLGKKIEAYDVKMRDARRCWCSPLSILGFTAWAAVSDWGQRGPEQRRPARLQRDPLRLQLRHRQQRQRLRRPHRQPRQRRPALQRHARHRHAHRPLPHDRPDPGARRHRWRQKKLIPPSAGTFPVAGATFVVLLIGTVLLVGALTFLPGPRARPHRRALPDARRHSCSNLASTSLDHAHDHQIHSLFDPAIIDAGDRETRSRSSIRVLMLKNPVMFVTLVGAVLTTFGSSSPPTEPFGFVLQIALWLWFTVLFANFAEAVAEGRGKAQARRAAQGRAQGHHARRRLKDGTDRDGRRQPARERATSSSAKPATSSPPTAKSSKASPASTKSAITGESAPVIRESGGDRSAVTGGTRVHQRPHRHPHHRGNRATLSSTA